VRRAGAFRRVVVVVRVVLVERLWLVDRFVRRRRPGTGVLLCVGRRR
jgi:hypothetical protein